jgi:hypothetical protein
MKRTGTESVETQRRLNSANQKWSGMTKNKNVEHTNESP